MKTYKPIFKDYTFSLEEDIRLTDLSKSAGMSLLTRKFRKARNKKLGAENKTAKLFDVVISKKNGYVTFLFYTEPTSEPENVMVTKPKSMRLVPDALYHPRIRILDFFKLAQTKPGYNSSKELSIAELKEIMDVANIQLWCDCPSFHWQGMNYNISMFDGSVYPTNIPPEHWNKYHGENQLVCKHLGGITNQFKFFLGPMSSMLNFRLKSI